MANNQENIVRRLADLAYSVANLGKALDSAKSAGDLDYYMENYSSFTQMSEELYQLKATATDAEIREAREITNAPI